MYTDEKNKEDGLTLLTRHPGLVAGVTPLVLLHLLQLVVVKAHALLDTLLHEAQAQMNRGQRSKDSSGTNSGGGGGT